MGLEYKENVFNFGGENSGLKFLIQLLRLTSEIYLKIYMLNYNLLVAKYFNYNLRNTLGVKSIDQIKACFLIFVRKITN